MTAESSGWVEMRAAIAVIACLAAALGGCGAARRAQERSERQENLQSALSLCSTGKFRTKLEAAQCVGNAEETFLDPASFGADLIRVKIASRNAIAAKLDAGRITQAEADLENAQVRSELAAEANRRIANARIATAQEGIAAAATRQTRPATCIGGPAIVSCF